MILSQGYSPRIFSKDILQGYSSLKLQITGWKCYGRHTDRVYKFDTTVTYVEGSVHRPWNSMRWVWTLAGVEIRTHSLVVHRTIHWYSDGPANVKMVLPHWTNNIWFEHDGPQDYIISSVWFRWSCSFSAGVISCHCQTNVWMSYWRAYGNYN